MVCAVDGLRVGRLNYDAATAVASSVRVSPPLLVPLKFADNQHYVNTTIHYCIRCTTTHRPAMSLQVDRPALQGPCSGALRCRYGVTVRLTVASCGFRSVRASSPEVRWTLGSSANTVQLGWAGA